VIAKIKEIKVSISLQSVMLNPTAVPFMMMISAVSFKSFVILKW
tara:strand:- start:697 stop:828 length:132 start_codon:yes stop_codon:yes gene_type:complete